MSYFNTVHLSGEDLKNAIIRAKNQDEAIMHLFLNTRKTYSPSRILTIMQKAGKQWPIVSVRRSLTNLTTKGELVKKNEMVEGAYGSPEHLWELNYSKYPTKDYSQAKMFN